MKRHKYNLESNYDLSNAIFQWVFIDIINIKYHDLESELYSLIGIVDIYDAYTFFFCIFQWIMPLYYQLKSNEYQNKILSISNSYLTKILFIDFNW